MDCLILVDLQNDFMPGGALAVPRGDEVVEVANRIAPEFDLVVASQDWHPGNHLSFASQHSGRSVGDVIQLAGADQVLWPDHCVQGTRGAEFHDGLAASRIDLRIRKGTNRRIDSYSAFFDNARQRSTGLADLLRARGVTAVWLVGLATDYCVKFTALDALEQGFETAVVSDGCRGIDLAPGDVAAAWAAMERAGAKIVTAGRLR